MRILSIDQSYTSSGIVMFDDGEVTHIENFKTSKEENIFKRAQLVAERIRQLAHTFEPHIIAIEGLAFGMRGNATRDLAGLQFVIIVELQIRHGYDVEIIAPLSVKKFATGNGRAKKEELMSATPTNILDRFKDELGVKKTTGLLDMVDAYWIGKVVDSKHKNKVDNKVNK